VWDAVPQDGEPDARLRFLLVHIHVVQRAFLHVWTERSLGEAFKEPEDFATLGEVRAWARPYYRDAHAFVDALTDDRLSNVLVMPWAAQLTETLGRPPGQTLVADTCFQVTSHSTYHRGQVNARLREIGKEPPLVDYIAWVWFGRPHPEWTD
jgi:uncharacterized damage-inducible protein DinB